MCFSLRGSKPNRIKNKHLVNRAVSRQCSSFGVALPVTRPNLTCNLTLTQRLLLNNVNLSYVTKDMFVEKT